MSNLQRQIGFTLVEAMISVAIVALAMGVVLVNFGAAGANVRSIAGKLSGTIRATYDNAALTGQTHRLVFDFEKSIIKVEATERVIAMDENANPLIRGARAASHAAGAGFGLGGLAAMGMDLNDMDAVLDEMIEAGPPTALTALAGLNEEAKENGPSVFKSLGRDLPLGTGVHLVDVWIRGMDEPVNEGETYLLFFPHGYTQEAMIHLEDDEGRVFTISVRALTGRTEAVPEYLEVPE